VATSTGLSELRVATRNLSGREQPEHGRDVNILAHINSSGVVTMIVNQQVSLLGGVVVYNVVILRRSPTAP